MKTQRVEALIGLLVLSVAGFFLFQILGNIASASNGEKYILQAEFSSAEGVSLGSPVRMAGVPIGDVAAIALDAENFTAIVDLAIDEDVRVPLDSEVNVASDGLLGGAFIEVVAGADSATLEEGDRFAYSNGAVSLINLFASFATGGGEE